MTRPPIGHRSKYSLALAALALVAWLWLPASPVSSQTQAVNLIRGEVETKGKITDLVVDDLDGDGKKDLLLIMGRELRLHFQGSEGGYRPDPEQRFKLDPRAILFDVGDLDGDGKKEVVLLREDGVFAHRLDVVDGRPFYALKLEKLIACETLLRRASDDEARRKEFVKDLDGDGKIDVLVPERAGFAVHRNVTEKGKKVEFEPRALLPTPPISMIDTGDDKLSSSLLATYWLANPTIADWDADGRADIVLAQEGDLAVFKPGAGGGPAIPRAPVLRQAIPGTKSFSLDAERPFELDFTMPLILRDLDHDGRVDAALTHVGQGTTRIFMNGASPAEAFKTPRKVVRAKGITFIAFFIDLNGDGLEDMILPRMDKIGIWSILKIVVTRSVPVEAQFFYQRKDATAFPDEPDATRSFEIPVSLHSRGDGLDVGTTLIASLDGDFDGDGKKDLLYRTGSRKLSIFPGRADRNGVAENASTELEIRSSDDYRFVLPVVEDLNGDGLSDVVLRYFSWDRKDDRIVTFLSLKK